MFRSKKDEELSEEDYLELSQPFNDKIDEFMEKYIIPEFGAFYLANGYESGAIEENSYDILVNVILSLLGQTSEIKNRDAIKKNIKIFLKLKYGITVINEEPLDFDFIDKN